MLELRLRLLGSVSLLQKKRLQRGKPTSQLRNHLLDKSGFCTYIARKHGTNTGPD